MFSTLIPTGLLPIPELCFFFLPRDCGHRCWTIAGPGCRRGDVGSEGYFWGEQERQLSWMPAVCCCSTFAWLHLQQAAGEVQPGRSGRVEGSLLYPGKCYAWSHGASQWNFLGVKKKERDRKGTRDKGRNKVKKCAMKLLAAKRRESNFQLLSSWRWSH